MITHSGSSTGSPRFFAALGLALALAFSFASFFATTRHGMGLGNDSLAFTGPALARLHGQEAINLHHPPLYGLSLWAIAKVGSIDVVDASAYVQLFAITALITAVWWQLRWSLPQNKFAPAAGALLLAVSFPIVEHAGNVGSDLLGAALAMWTLGLLARHLATERGWQWLGLALITASLAFLNRFAAFGLVFSVSCVLWLQRGRPFSRDFFTALFTGFVMVLPCAFYLLGNSAVAGRATTRELGWNGIAWDRVRESLATLSIWYLPNQLALWPVGLAVIIAAGGWLWFGRARYREIPPARALVFTQVGFLGANFIFLILTIGLVEFGLALDSRTLLPCLPSSIVLGVVLVSLVPVVTAWRRIAVVGIFLFVLGNNARRSSFLVASYSVLGKGHLGTSYVQSVLPDFVHAHPTAVFIATNPPFFFNLTRTPCLELPTEFSLLSNKRNPDLAAEVARLRARLRGRDPAYLVVFDLVDREGRVPAERLMEGDRFERVMHDYFVSVYRFAPPSGAAAK